MQPLLPGQPSRPRSKTPDTRQLMEQIGSCKTKREAKNYCSILQTGQFIQMDEESQQRFLLECEKKAAEFSLTRNPECASFCCIRYLLKKASSRE